MQRPLRLSREVTGLAALATTLTVLLVTLATVGVAVAIALWLLVRRLVPVVLRAVDRLLTGLHPRVRAALRASVREPNPLHPPTKEHAPMAEPNLAILYSRLGREVGLKRQSRISIAACCPTPCWHATSRTWTRPPSSTCAGT
jgi:hypothetical protein